VAKTRLDSVDQSLRDYRGGHRPILEDHRSFPSGFYSLRFAACSLLDTIVASRPFERDWKEQVPAKEAGLVVLSPREAAALQGSSCCLETVVSAVGDDDGALAEMPPSRRVTRAMTAAAKREPKGDWAVRVALAGDFPLLLREEEGQPPRARRFYYWVSEQTIEIETAELQDSEVAMGRGEDLAPLDVGCGDHSLGWLACACGPSSFLHD
jgi:hypothetical protein